MSEEKKKVVAKKVVKKPIEKAPAKKKVVKKVIKEVVKERLHEGQIVTSSELFVLNGHPVERLHLANGCQTIIPQ